MSAAPELVCRDEQRKAVVLEHPTLNGIDYVEYDEFPALPFVQRYRLSITFLKPPPAGLVGADIAISGGVRITGILPLPGPLTTAPSPPAPPFTLFVQLDGAGDFSTYQVQVRHDTLDAPLDYELFSFKAGCPSELDCLPRDDCPPAALVEPVLDYLAKDFASFRRLLLDVAQSRNPRWQESAVAELGTVLLELFAHKGDLISWSQDAVATEAFLETCRLRVSARRHARLIDHRMHDGRNAFSFTVLEATSPAMVTMGTRFLTRITRPLRGEINAPGPVMGPLPESAFDDDPALRSAQVFEATANVHIDPTLNRLFIHTQGNTECCLPRGTNGVFLYRVGAGQMAERPALQPGDWLLLEEVRGATSGSLADVNPQQRRFVRLVVVRNTDAGGGALVDPAFQALLAGTAEEPSLQAIGPLDGARPRLPLVEVIWRDEDALDITLCLSARTPRGDAIDHILAVRGNVVPVDHGRTVTASLGDVPAELPGFSREVILHLPAGPLSFEAADGGGPFDGNGRPIAGRHRLDVEVRAATPAVTVGLTLPGAPPARWRAVPELLDSGPFDEHFCVEADDRGVASLRFGDGAHGRSVQGATALVARFRIGNGVDGNVGRDAIAHLVLPPPGGGIALRSVRQPIAARAGQAPETVAQVLALAPAAMRAVQFRAVTEADWQTRALTVHGVVDAKATFRWTGSWHTVFVALHPAEPADLLTLPGGRTQLGERFSGRAMATLTRVRLAGYDLVLGTAIYVPLKLVIQVCVAPGHFRGAVLQAVSETLSNRRFADGRSGFFEARRMSFGEPVRLSRIIAAVQAIVGVSSLEVLEFRRYWLLANGELASGLLPLGPFEIARLDNDPNLPENGVLVLLAVGGL